MVPFRYCKHADKKIKHSSKVREMRNSSEFFKSNFDYYQRVAHKKLEKI
jgi:hypothetical protein